MQIESRNWLAKARGTFPGDPRYYQLLSLGLLLGYGKCCMQFDIGAGQIAITLASVLAAQFLCSRFLARANSLRACLENHFAVAALGINQSFPTSAATFWKQTLTFDPKSALISGLSLCLLLRTNSPLIAMTAAFAAILGKFLLRWHGKHIFNPTNFGLVVTMLCVGEKVWVSPGQWGNVAFFGFLMACLGGWVVCRWLFRGTACKTAGSCSSLFL